MKERRSIPRLIALAFAWLSMGGGTVFALLYLVPSLQTVLAKVAMLASFIPYGVAAWLVAVVLFALAGRGRGRWLVAPALVGLIAQVAWTAPYWPHQPPAAQGEPFTVLSINLHYGKADADQVAAQIRASTPDVLVFVEDAQDFDVRLRATGVLDAYPHRTGDLADDPEQWWDPLDASGTLIVSRTPITWSDAVGSAYGQYVARVSRDRGPDVVVVAAHPRNMTAGTPRWLNDASLLSDAVRPHLAEPLVLAGDLNATAEQITLRRLIDLGLENAASESGSGWLPTYPANQPPIPPMIAIDHVLTNDRVAAQRVRTFHVDGTDHLGLVAELVVP